LCKQAAGAQHDNKTSQFEQNNELESIKNKGREK
jgi:hypothetical protein